MVVRVPGGFKIRSHITGKIYPKLYASRQAAEKRIRKMMMFKFMKGGGKNGW